MIECFSFKKKSNALATDDIAFSIDLNFEQRQKSRALANTIEGEKISWFLERGHVLSDGDVLIGKSGEKIKINAALETLSEVLCEDDLLLARIAYHLGNRHVPLQIQKNTLSFQHDHVLDDMVRGLGGSVNCVEKPFSPESGAYHSHGAEQGGESDDAHQHNHSDDHSHSHAHN